MRGGRAGAFGPEGVVFAAAEAKLIRTQISGEVRGFWTPAARRAARRNPVRVGARRRPEFLAHSVRPAVETLPAVQHERLCLAQQEKARSKEVGLFCSCDPPAESICVFGERQ
jgi:hypothetical protein